MKHTRLILASIIAFSVSALSAGEPVKLSLDSFTDQKGGKVPAGWVEEADGVIHRKEKAGDIISKKDFSDFIIEWDWKVAEGANSGLKYWVNNFSKNADKPSWLGIEYQMIDDDRHPDAHRGDNHNTACIYDIKATITGKPVKPAGEWNTSKVISQGGKLQHFLNGKLVVESDTKSAEWPELIAKSKFKKVEGFAPGKGRFLLQDHGDEVWFKNIRVTTP